MFYCNLKSSKEKKSFYQNKKLEMLNYIKDSLERKIASVNASIEVLKNQINKDQESADRSSFAIEGLKKTVEWYLKKIQNL